MKFFDCATAPNPRRVRIFLAEKGVAIPTQQIDLAGGEQFSPSFRAINPRCSVPVLVLDDGTAISDVLAICRYIEDLHPSPALMGTSPKDKAVIAMWERRMEVDGLLAAAEALRNSAPRLKGRALVGPHDYEQIPALAERGRARLLDFYNDLELRLADSPFVAGPEFSVADITAILAVDFATRIKLPMPDGAKAVRRWYEAMSARPSMSV